ncbi:olfactory receptor 6C70-like [Anomaloglossus baeobatrachus]|uniref:olfactory receptor 6C70-like n=1 Tax=Anomaloglossus baeobatrachus TaxID=238106 RepID=UPI003F5023DE
MCEDNHTTVTYVLLLGFQNLKSFKIPLFVILLLVYIVILVGNLLVVLTVLIAKNLRHPMYIFLQNLALSDFLFSSVVVPQLLYITWWETGQLLMLKFCDSNIIDHFFCDLSPILNLSSSDTSVIIWSTRFKDISVVFISRSFYIGFEILESPGMCEDNHTTVTYVLLLGFQDLQNFKIPLFVILLLVYIVILVGNLLVVLTVLIAKNLRHPMYIFLQNLAFCDFLFSSVVVPQLLYVTWWETGQLLMVGCIFQFYMYSFLGIVQSFLLTVMAYDRYLAICDPLRYSSLLSIKHCHQLVYLSWSLAFVLDSVEVIFIFHLKFCDSNIIDHFFCDLSPILELASSDTFIIIWQDLFLSVIAILLPFLFVLVSYTCIVITILNIPSITGRKKAFSTCSTHLLLVVIYYGALIALYLAPSGDNSHNANKFKSLINMVMNPFSNPLIYSVRNKELVRGFKTFIHRQLWTK